MGAALSDQRGAGPCDMAAAPVTEPDMGMLAAPREIAGSLGMGRDEVAGEGEAAFTGPLPGSDADPEHLARACWVLALLTEVFRRGPMVAALGPLGRLQDRRPSADVLLALAPPAALGQLAAPASRDLRQSVICELYSPSRRSSAPRSRPVCSWSYSCTIRALYAAVKARRFGCPARGPLPEATAPSCPAAADGMSAKVIVTSR